MKRFYHLARAALVAVACIASAASAQAPTSAPAQAPAEPAQILVMLRQKPPHFRPGSDYAGSYGDTTARAAREHIGVRIARAHALTISGAWPMPVIGLDCLVMTVPDGRSTEAVIAEVSRDPAVAWAQPMHVYRTRGGPGSGDPLFQAEPSARLWHLAELHQLATGRGVTIAVVDTRIDASHPDLAGQVRMSEDFVLGHPAGPEQHGTAVAGVIAAKAGNGIGIAGVAPEAHLMGLRACWQLAGAAGSVCDSLSLAKALSFAIEHRAQIVNLSLSGPPDLLLDRLVKASLARGQLVIAAFDPSLPAGGFPASEPGVTAVATRGGSPPPRGVYTAPGDGIPTTEPGGRWSLVNGSSFAAAHVSGLAALMLQRGTSARGQRAAFATGTGGAIDALATLRLAPRSCDLACSQQLAANARR
jgi:subtilisin family serine protease